MKITDSSDLTKEEQFVLKEYDNAVQLTYHIDELRNKLTSFYVTFAGVAVAGMALIIQGNTSDATVVGDIRLIMAVVTVAIGSIGIVVIRGLARIRAVQIEYMTIIDNIRSYFIGDNYALENVLALSRKTLPSPSRSSGTYAWVLLVMLVTSILFASALYIFGLWYEEPEHLDGCAWSAALCFILSFIIQDQFYFSWAKPRPRITHTR